MGVVGDLSEFFGFSDSDINLTTPSSQVGQTGVVSRIERAIQDFGTEDDELIQSQRRQARREVESQAERNQERVNRELEKRGISDSGIAVEASQDVARQADQALVDALANINKTQAQRQGQAIESGLQLQRLRNQIARADAEARNAQTTARENQEQQGLTRLTEGVSALLQTEPGERVTDEISSGVNTAFDFVFGEEESGSSTTASASDIEGSLSSDRGDFEINYGTEDAAESAGFNGGISGGGISFSGGF